MFVIVWVASACSSGGSATEIEPPAATSTVSTSPSPATTGSTAIEPATTETTPDLTLDAQRAWFLEVLNGAEVTEADYERRFAPVFSNQVSHADFVELTPELTGGATGWVIVGTPERAGLSSNFLIAPAAGTPVARVALAVTNGGRIETLLVQPQEEPTLDTRPGSRDEATSRLSDFGQLGLLVADVSDGTCEPVDELLSTAPAPIASAVKLYVLGAVAAAIEGGELAWDDEFVFSDDVASLPSGVTQDEPVGTSLTVLELATRMISISDNTATDMLIEAVGRAAVIDAQTTMGHDAPELNRPLLTTRELFTIKLDPELLEQYADADTAERQVILDDIAGRSLPTMQFEVFERAPWGPDVVEWFASPLDLCEALVHLTTIAGRTGLEPVRDIMTQNPGVASETADEIWFKGGSEPGVLSVAWLVEQGDRTFTVTGSVVNPDEIFDETEAILLFAAVRDLADE